MANIQFQIRRGLSTEWSSVNPVLSAGEPGFETDTNLLKVGDGLTSWNSLSYLDASAVGGYPLLLSSLQDGDVLSFHQASSSWVNRDKREIVDGGNF